MMPDIHGGEPILLREQEVAGSNPAAPTNDFTLAGIVRETTGRKWGRIFLAYEIMSFMYETPQAESEEADR